ncbi:MAG: GNAT family N-acetyltransferase [Anaerolineales bacterium]|nr:GNAT family N-acetyltransferase [Anaerolineales bacterium]
MKLLDSLDDHEVDMLVAILNGDNELRSWLGTEAAPVITRQEFRQTSQDWARKNCAMVYAILSGEPLGTISLSHITADGKARIGYWISSEFWSRGVGSRAFQKILENAKVQDVKEVSASIEEHNQASLKIWRRFGAELVPGATGMINARIKLVNTQDGC